MPAEKRFRSAGWAEKQLKKLERQIEGQKAYREYRARQAGTLANMERLRLLRLARGSQR